MSRLTQKGQGSPVALFSSSTDVSLETVTGARFDSSDGREFVLVSVGASNIAAGLLVQSSAVVANHQNLAASTAAVGATSITVTLGGTAATANQYRGGFLYVNAGTGIGQTLKIASHPAQSNGSGTLVITLEDPVQVATSVSDTKVCLLANPALNVIVNPTTPTGQILGATLYPVTAATYALIQSRGQIALTSETLVATVGLGIAASAATAGFSRSATAAGAYAIGVAYQTAVSGEARAAWLAL